MSTVLLRFALGLSAASVVACGGTGRPAEPSSGAPAPAARAGAVEHDAPADDASDSSPPSPEELCKDGTCAACGDALCPAGWYCDETAPSGPACGWLPECASKTSCACLKKALKDCDCEEASGGAHLTCR